MILVLRPSVWRVLTAGVVDTHPPLNWALPGHCRTPAQIWARGPDPAHEDEHVKSPPDWS